MSTNLIFIHGINTHTAGYSDRLFANIITAYKKAWRKRGLSCAEAKSKADALVHREILWAHKTSALTNHYVKLQYGLRKRKGNWNFFLERVDPLVIQILYYVKDKGHKTGHMDILKTIHHSVRSACANRPANVVFIAHSLGSVIAYDYIFGFRRYRLSSTINVEAFITLGSPLPLFTAAMGYVENPAMPPSNLKRWINILDPDDAVARYSKNHFKHIAIDEVEVETGWDPLNAHTNYWRDNDVAQCIAEKLVSWHAARLVPRSSQQYKPH